MRSQEAPSSWGVDEPPKAAERPAEAEPESDPSWGTEKERRKTPRTKLLAPPVPHTLAETGLSGPEILDLVMKTLYQRGKMVGADLAHAVALPFQVLDDLTFQAQQRHFLEVLGAAGHGRVGYTFELTEEGRKRARAALETNKYVGPAPVPLALFSDWVLKQSVRYQHVRREDLSRAFQDLVLSHEVLEALGPALNSGSSIFLHGAPGNGKTAIAERVGRLTSAEMYLPYALSAGGNIMVLFDPVYHELVEPTAMENTAGKGLLRPTGSHDQRFVKVKRPTVFVGGELTMEQLDLQYDANSGVYQAPFQLKAAGGVLIIDDFGRQRMRAAELLNRWIVPLEKGVDNLTLHTGVKFPVPFDCILIFATNLNPSDLVDEAFLRRIRFKVEVKSPSREAYEGIFKMNCEAEGMDYDPGAVETLFSEYYEPMGFSPRGCHPRDLLHHIQTIAKFGDVEPNLGKEFLHRAARSYFLVVEEEYQGGVPSIKTGSHA